MKRRRKRLRRARLDARRHTLHRAREAREKHLVSQRAMARQLGIPSSTFNDWEHAEKTGEFGTLRVGRPCLREPRVTRMAVVDTLRETRGTISLESLKALFPEVTRTRLKRLRDIYESTKSDRGRIHLEWTTLGSVWSADYTELKRTACGERVWALAVRDLASGMILATVMTAHATAERTCAVLATLFSRYGAPLVLKTDNGSHFTAAIVAGLLAKHAVIHLLSPPYFPRYNGAIEAGMNVIKQRLQAIAEDPGITTMDDLERARGVSNASICQRRRTSADQRWDQGRRAFLPPERASLRAAIATAHAELLAALDAKSRALLDTDSTARATLARRAIEHALVERGYLKVQRSRNANMSTELVAKLSEN